MFIGVFPYTILYIVLSSNDTGRILDSKKTELKLKGGCSDHMILQGEYFVAAHYKYDLRATRNTPTNLMLSASSKQTKLSQIELKQYGDRFSKDDFVVNSWVVYDSFLLNEKNQYTICINANSSSIFEEVQYFIIKNTGRWGNGPKNVPAL